MSFYRYHLFFCTNRREGAACCADHGAQSLRDYAKERVKALGLADIRVNSAGCLGRCEHGPVLVVYPETCWYSYVDREDIDEIIEQHLQLGQPVERLLLKS